MDCIDEIFMTRFGNSDIPVIYLRAVRVVAMLITLERPCVIMVDDELTGWTYICEYMHVSMMRKCRTYYMPCGQGRGYQI